MSSTTTKVPNQSSLAKLTESGSAEVQDEWRFILNKHYMSHSSSVVESAVPIPDELESVQTLKSLEFMQSMAMSIN